MRQDNGSVRRASSVAIAACTVWLVGIAPVPRVYTEPDPARRLELLRSGRVAWIVGEHVAAAGTAAVPAAFARIALALPRGRARTFMAFSAAALAAGAPLFVNDLAIRASNFERFAARGLPAWTFRTYAWLHVAALASLASALGNSPDHRRTAAFVGLTAAVSASALARSGDMVPAFFYLAEGAAAASLARRRLS